MNFLAHAYLSFGHPEILVGNMVSDFVKGKKKYDFPEKIQAGIQLHRDIDYFTDIHPVTAEANKVFKPAVGLYAGAFMDVVYDHFLALDDQEFSGNTLAGFAADTYATLEAYSAFFPPAFVQVFQYMKTHNWLLGYQQKPGIEKSFRGIAQRATYLNDSSAVYEAFEKNYEYLNTCYQRFFPFVKNFAKEKLQLLNN